MGVQGSPAPGADEGEDPDRVSKERRSHSYEWRIVRSLLLAAAIAATLTERERIASVLAFIAEIGELVWGPANP
jgi:hypothetical protein